MRRYIVAVSLLPGIFERLARLEPLDGQIRASYDVGMRFPGSPSDDRLRAAFGMRPGLALVIGGVFLAIVPLAILFLSLQRFWRIDLISGSIKA